MYEDKLDIKPYADTFDQCDIDQFPSHREGN